MTTDTLKIIAGKGLMIATISLLAACGSESSNTSSENSAATVQSSPSADNGFYDIPPPIQQVELLQKAGATYDKSIMNPLDNVSKYSMNNSMALNLGVYGSDLSYAAVFNQAQDVVLYLNASKKLADALSIKGNFYPQIMARMEKNSGNKDSLLQIVSDVCRGSNESLKENDQSHLSALVVAGSFIEAMYIATQVAKEVETKDAIYQRIGEFKGSLNNLVALITTVHDSDVSDVLMELKSIKAVYDETSEAKMTEAQMTKITKQVNAIRIKITNM